MGARQVVKRQLRRLGLDVRRHRPGFTFAERRQGWIERLDVDTVIDCGAHRGAWARALRVDGFEGRILSFEPLSTSYRELAEEASADPLWDARRLALADRPGREQMNISANDSSASSLLPLRPGFSPDARTVATEVVEVARLDEVVEPEDLGRTFVKCDVQGAEARLLGGAQGVLERTLLLQIELALVERYEGQALFADIVDRLEGMDFHLVDLDRVYADWRTGKLIEVDGLFVEGSAAIAAQAGLAASPDPWTS